MWRLQFLSISVWRNSKSEKKVLTMQGGGWIELIVVSGSSTSFKSAAGCVQVDRVSR